jgi:hypothetical protein
VVAEGGYEFAPDNEINGISLVGVGSGTTMEYIQVEGNSDDGIEFYGGDVNVKYGVFTNNLDDSVDWTKVIKVTSSTSSSSNPTQAVVKPSKWIRRALLSHCPSQPLLI